MAEKKAISKAERRYIAREIQAGRLSYAEAEDRFELNTTNVSSLLRTWVQRYGSDIALTLPVMTEKERVKLDAAQKRMKELEQQLEDAQMKNIALETMIDIAEEQLRIAIRKKSGLKQ